MALAVAILLAMNDSAAYSASSPSVYQTATTIAGMTERQFMTILQEKMPLPILHFYRVQKGDTFIYAIEMNSAGFPVKSDVLTVSFELGVEASADELISMIDRAARQVRLESIRVFERNADQ